MIKKFIHYYKRHWKLFFTVLACAFTMSGLDLVFPYATQQMIDQYIPERNLVMIIRIAIFLLILYILRFTFQYIVHYWGHVVGIRMETDMRKKLFSHLQTLSFKFYDNNKVGYLMSRIVNDLHNVSELAHHGPEDLFISSILIIGSFNILVRMNWQLALFTFSLIPVMIFFSIKLGRRMHQNFRDIREKVAEVNSQIEDSLSGIRVVKSFTNEPYENSKFDQGNNRFRLSRESAMKTMASFFAGINFFSNMITLITISAGGYYVYQGQLKVGQLVAFLFYVNMFMNPVRRLVTLNENFQQGMAGFGRFQELLRVQPEFTDQKGALELTGVKGDIEYREVSFGYGDDSKVLEHINLKIEANQTVAFVGPSGAGKTTLCNLLPRFYEIESGQLFIDGTDIREIKLASLRSNIGIVQQDVFLFNGTVKDNIAYGKPGASDEEIIEAARQANADQFIIKLRNGYQTDIGERGVKLSGGQKQRIAIARTFLKNPPILILDEATSSLDNESEKIIQASLVRLARDRTTLVIAHRLTTIKNADLIIVLTEEGIVEQGKHEELIREKGVYQRLYQNQFKDLSVAN